MKKRVNSPGAFSRGSFLIGLLWYTHAVFAQDVSIDQARNWFDSGEHALAKNAFEQVLAMHPDDPVALYHLGQYQEN